MSEIKQINTASFEMEYLTFGNGSRTFVIIPGISMDSVMPAAIALEASFASFKEDYTVYLFDRKKNICSDYSVLDMAKDTAEAMKLIGIRQADIFGASQGGMIAMSIAVLYPELVHALYLGSTMARGNAVSNATMDKWMSLAKGSDLTEAYHVLNTMIYSEEYYHTYQNAFRIMESHVTPENMTRFYYLAKACREFDVYDRLPEIKCPVFAVGSHCDHVLSGEATEEIAEALGCPLKMYDGFSHAVYDEAPDYRDIMLQSLRSTWK